MVRLVGVFVFLLSLFLSVYSQTITTTVTVTTTLSPTLQITLTPSVINTFTTTLTATPTVTPSSNATVTPTESPSVSNVATLTPTVSPSNSSTTSPSESPTVTPSESVEASPSPSVSLTATATIPLSASNTRTPTQSRFVASESSTNTASSTATPSAFASPSSTRSIDFPSYLPVFAQPSGISTGEVIIQLRTINYSFGVGIDREIQTTIALIMGIPFEAVIVVRITATDQATVIVCTGNIDAFFNSLNNQDAIFDDTVLDHAYVEFIFWGVPCVDPLSDLPSISKPSSGDSNSYSTFDFSTFRFPNIVSATVVTSEESSDVPSSRYLSDGQIIVPLDDDEYFIINVNHSNILIPSILFSFMILIIFSLLF